MKRLITIITILLISAVVVGADNEPKKGWINFKPESIFTYNDFAFGGDAIFLIGKLDTGGKVAFLVGITKLNKDDKTTFIANTAVWFNEDKCRTIDDIKKYARVTWYKIVVNSWISLKDGSKNGPLEKEYDYYSLANGSKKLDYNTFQSIPPISEEKLK